MTIDEILDLLHAGYTKEEINALESPAPAQDPAPAQNTAQANETAPSQAPTEILPTVPNTTTTETAAESVPAGAGNQEIDALKKQIAELTAAMQRNNIQNPPGHKPDEIETEVDIMEKMLDRDLLI